MALMVACHLATGLSHAQQKDSVVVYNDQRPLVYEDAVNFYPFAYINKGGKPDGYNVALVRLLLSIHTSMLR